MEFDGDTDKYIYTAEVKTSLYIYLTGTPINIYIRQK